MLDVDVIRCSDVCGGGGGPGVLFDVLSQSNVSANSLAGSNDVFK